MQNANKKTSNSGEEEAAQALIGKFTSGEIIKLEPVFDPQTGYRYIIDDTKFAQPKKVDDQLQKLVQDKILEQKLFDKVIHCPSCGASGISSRYCCPKCKSIDIKKTSLIGHIKCGYMDREDKFTRGTVLFCPKCNEELKQPNVDYRKAGVWFDCRECGNSFDVPLIQQYCPRCRNVTTYGDAIIEDVYSYSLSESAKNKLSATALIVAPIHDLLVNMGLKVESPSFLKGKSGAKHPFSISASNPKTNSVIVVDLTMSTEGPVTEQPVFALFAKTFDISPSKAYLIAIPKLTETAVKMAELYGIVTVEAKKPADAVILFKEKLDEKLTK